MKTTTSDHLLQRLREWGVRRVFGCPGDGIHGLMGAFDRAGETMEFVQARHEELAAFMACGHAKFTGEIGVCMATSGPGAIHLLNGLYDARLDHQPVVAIVGQQARAALGGDFQQEVDLHSLYKDVAGAYVTTVLVPAQVRHAVDRALRIALEQRTVTCIVVPHDVQELEAVPVPPREHGTVHSGVGITSSAQVPSTEALARAAGILNAGRRVAILAGAGALHAGDELVEVAEILGAGIAKALLGKAAVPDDLRFVTGAIGLLGTQPSWDLMNRCDTLLMVGSSFPYSEYLPAEGQARGVQIDIDTRQLGIRYPMELNLVGDSRETLRGLIPYLEPKSDRRWRNEIEDGVAQWWRVLEVRAMNDAHPVNPQRVFWELSPRLPDRCIVTGDSGSTAAWLARDVRLRHGMRCSLSGGLASMGSAIPYALAAKLAHSDRPVVALLGDGAMQMLGLNGLITIAHRWSDWRDPRLAVLVLNIGDLNRVTWEQRTMAGVPRFKASETRPAFPYAEFARMLGLHAVRVDEPGQLGAAWDEVLHADRPAVLEVMADPNVPPIPPHVTHKQVKAYLSALRQRDPDVLRTMIATAKEWWDGKFPPKRPRR
jgi:pyruvate dehydrogenase (quinone)